MEVLFEDIAHGIGRALELTAIVLVVIGAVVLDLLLDRDVEKVIELTQRSRTGAG